LPFAKEQLAMTNDVVKFLSAAWDAANSAGEIIRDSWHQPKSIDYKGAINLVTSVDRETERSIVELIRRNFPSHSILAEEETNVESKENEYRWIIDPLDGTTNFAHGYPQVSISVALEYGGQPILGLVYDPLRRECFRAVKGQGATLNGSPIEISFLTRCQGIRRNGSAALDLCYVACGRIDGFWELKLRPWDTAAASLIVAEAGGTISDFSGNQFSIWGNETLASNGLIHAEMLAALKASLS
jgi:myo-inositol-1(or 4)-monophosphatase